MAFPDKLTLPELNPPIPVDTATEPDISKASVERNTMLPAVTPAFPVVTPMLPPCSNVLVPIRRVAAPLDCAALEVVKSKLPV